MAWFRLHESTLDNPKVQKLPDRLFKAWINFLCVASRYGGMLPSVADISFAMRKSEEEIRKLITALIGAKLIDETDEGLKPHDWSDHQFQSDVSTPRVKRFRERRKKPPETVSGNAPEQSRRKAPSGLSDSEDQTSPPIAERSTAPEGRAHGDVPAIPIKFNRMPS